MSRFLYPSDRRIALDNAHDDDEAAMPRPVEPRPRQDEGRRTPLVSLADATKPRQQLTHSKLKPCSQAEGEPTSDTPSCWHCICLSVEESR